MYTNKCKSEKRNTVFGSTFLLSGIQIVFKTYSFLLPLGMQRFTNYKQLLFSTLYRRISF